MFSGLTKKLEDRLFNFGITKKFMHALPAIYSLYLYLRARTYVDRGNIAIQAGVDLTTKGNKSNIFFLSKVVGKKGKVIAIEPDPKNVKKIKDYINKEEVNNIVVIEKAVWNKKGNMEFLLHKESWSNKLKVVNTNIKGFVDSVIVETDTIDSIIDCYDKKLMSRIKHVCLTVNGSELEALEGMDKIMSRNKDITILIANQDNHSDPYYNSKRRDTTEKLLANHGFTLSCGKRWLLAKKKDNKDAF